MHEHHHKIIEAPDLSSTKECHYQQLTFDYEVIQTHYDPIYRALWCTIKSSKNPVFSNLLLSNIRTLQDAIAQFCSENPTRKPKYLIWQSDNHKVFSLGLDLDFIHKNILTKNEDGLHQYIQTCIDVFYINLMKLDISPLITVTLIRGKAYGGGFEAALSSDIIVTEENARCCFPEMRYHLLPSLGTLKMLLRKYPHSAIQPLLFNSKQLDLNKLQELGFIETIVEHGNGEKYIKDKIHQIHHKHELYYHLYEAKVRNIVITYHELEEFKNNWVNTALHLKDNDIRRLEKMALAQQKFAVSL